MTDKFTLAELNDMMQIMNCWSPDDCPVCASARQKLEKLIAREQEKPVKEVRDIGGISCIIEHTKG